MAAVILPVVGLAYLGWSVTAVPAVSPAPPAPTEYARWRALDVISAFRAAGLRAEVLRGETKDERDGLSGYIAGDARRFRIADGEGQMGMVLCFENPGDAWDMRDYYLALNKALPQFRSHLFVKDSILLQINQEVPEETARAYAQVLEMLDD
jgi:hypothetical protein